MLGESTETTSDSKYEITLAALDIKDAFLQVPQENLVEVSLYNQKYIIKRNLPGQRLGAKAWYWFFRDYVTNALQCEWSVEQPCLAHCTRDGVHNCFMIHVDDLLFTGSAKFWAETFLPTMEAKFNVSHSELKGDGTEISFLKRRLFKLSDGLLLIRGTTVEKVVAYFERFFGPARSHKIPCDSSVQNQDESRPLTPGDSKAYRSVIGLLLYVARDRIDVMFTVKELSSCMAAPTTLALQRLRKLIGYLKASGNMGIKLLIPEFGAGKTRQGAETFWLLETYTDADWSANKRHRRSTSCAIHMVNGNFTFGSSRTQRVVSLSSAESELHSMVSGCSDAIFIKRCLEFLSGSKVTHQQWTDNSAARMLVQRQGVGRIRHLSGKILWIQSLVLQDEVTVGQIPTAWNYSDVGTKPLARNRLLALLNQLGVTDPITFQSAGQEEYELAAVKTQHEQSLKTPYKSDSAHDSCMGP